LFYFFALYFFRMYSKFCGMYSSSHELLNIYTTTITSIPFPYSMP
jgi:hypothetical protein